MMSTSPVGHVAAFLEQHGYRRLPAPLVINRIEFRFPAVFGGAEKSSDLILVADTVSTKAAEVVRQVLGVARVLDVTGSRNPLTTVIVGPRPTQDELNEMTEVSRVLPVGAVSNGGGEQILANWLAVLTPLNQVDTDGIIADPIAELKERLDGLPDEIASLVELAYDGPHAVEERVNMILTRALEQAWEAEE